MILRSEAVFSYLCISNTWHKVDIHWKEGRKEMNNL